MRRFTPFAAGRGIRKTARRAGVLGLIVLGPLALAACGTAVGAGVGGLAGNQFGKGSGKTAATVGGVVAGGLAGHAITGD